MTKKIFLTLLLAGWGVALCAVPKIFVIVGVSGAPLDSVSVACFSAGRDSVTTLLTGPDGRADVDTARVAMLALRHRQHNPRLVSLAAVSGDTISMDGSYRLGEVEVRAEAAVRHLDHTSFRIGAEDMARYDNFYLALNEIPHLDVLPGVGLYYEGQSTVALQLDGVATSMGELSTIAKSDVLRVDVYDKPTANYAARGYTAVIDIITRSGLTGGNVGVSVEQAANPAVGENYASLFYNYRRSRFSLQYSNSNTRYSKFRNNEDLQYQFDGVEYHKQKLGLNSNDHRDNNDLTLSFQNNKRGSYLYNMKVGMGFNRNASDMRQEVHTTGLVFPASKQMKTGFDKYWVSNYFEKKFGPAARRSTLSANVLYRRFNTDYASAYREYATDGPATVDECTAHRTHYDAVMGETQYSLPQQKWGQVSLDVFGNYKNSSYLDYATPFQQHTYSFGGSLMFYGWHGKWSYYASMGAHWMRETQTQAARAVNVWLPVPRISVTWRPSRKWRWTLGYSYSGSVPTIAQLSETEQWEDTRLVYHGNKDLTPYRQHTISGGMNLNSKYLVLSFSANYRYSPDMFCQHFVATPKYMLETIVNLDEYTSLFGTVSFNIRPLGDNKWLIGSQVNGARITGESRTYDQQQHGQEGYQWKGYRYQWMAWTSVNMKKWSAQLFYQYPGRVAEGQLISPRTQYFHLSATYRPVKDLSLGVEWQMPLGMKWTESERTVAEAPVHYNNESCLDDRTNLVSFKLNWNFRFGKRHNNDNPQFSNGDSDTGILTK